MDAVFLKLLNVSISACWLILAVLLLRLIFKKAPKAVLVAMWALVAIRLLCPFHIESSLSLVPDSETVSREALTVPVVQSGRPIVSTPVPMDYEPVITQPPSAPTPPARSIASIAAVVWLSGMGIMGLYALISYGNVRRHIREAVPLEKGIYICDRLSTAFILGVFRPKIYLPSELAQTHVLYVIAHERTHLKRKDHWWKPLGFLLLSVHWFNPLLWLAYILLCKDIEAACDEAVIRKLGSAAKQPYCEALLECSIPKRMITACPVAFGEGGVRSRIQSVLSYKKPTVWILLASVLVCIGLAVGFLTNPKTTLEPAAEAFIREQIMAHHRSKNADDRACCVDQEVLAVKNRGGKTTVYSWVYYQEYTMENGQPEAQTGCHIPTVITVETEKDGYRLIEYWEPRDGSYYVSDIHRKFPWYLWRKATDSQRYVNQQQAACLEQAQPLLQSEAQNAVTPAVPVTPSLSELRNKYPQYFGLDTAKGLKVYVWQMAQDHYTWGLLPDKNAGYSQIRLMELLGFTGTSTREMQVIVASYQLPDSEIVICPITMPHSSYAYSIDDAYRQKVQTLFWTGYQHSQLLYSPYLSTVIDTETFDIDGDGIQEICELTPGPTSGLFTFQLNAYHAGKLKYANTYTSAFYVLSFAETPGGEMGLKAQTMDGQVHYFSFGVDDGNITLISDEQTAAFWGEQGVGSTNAPASYGLPPLDQAIFDAIQSHYRKSDGLEHIQSYRVLTQEQISGTPLAGNQAHTRLLTVYLTVLHMTYQPGSTIPQEVEGNFALTALTFEMDDEGTYTLKDYWVREQGDYTEQEIREKFPYPAASYALDTEAYAEDLTAECFEKAKGIL